MQILPYQYKANKVCTRCVMDDTVKGITFDEKGECTFCKIHDELEDKFPLNEKTPERLQSLVDKIKQDGRGKKYDCILGVSGGRDSTYTLYSAVKLGLRPLAVHFDNGWNSEIAVQNIKNATKILGVDLHTHVADWEEFKNLQKSFLFASVPDAEVPTDWVITSVLYKEAVSYDVKFIIHGHSFRTEGTPPLTWTYMDGLYVKDIFRKYGRGKIASFPIMTSFKYLYYILIKRIRQIRLLYYIEYNEKKVFDLLEKKLNWYNYGDKHHESHYTSFFQSYILPTKFNIDKRKLHYSAKIRTNQITREEALSIMRNDPFVGGEKLLLYCLKKLDLTEEDFLSIMNEDPKNFLHYKSYYKSIKRVKPLIVWGIKLGFIPDTVLKKYFDFNINES